MNYAEDAAKLRERLTKEKAKLDKEEERLRKGITQEENKQHRYAKEVALVQSQIWFLQDNLKKLQIKHNTAQWRKNATLQLLNDNLVRQIRLMHL